MADPKPTSERLETLKARWESDKGSRVFLQLADEYRRLGRETDAVAILNEGLQANPGHLGARVARGRSLLALGQAKESAVDLERVIEADPTQMVAYRLLVEAYIALRDGDRARQRLSVYGLLNDSDPEIETLDRQIRELERTERTGAWPVHRPPVQDAEESRVEPSPAASQEEAEAAIPEPPQPPTAPPPKPRSEAPAAASPTAATVQPSELSEPAGEADEAPLGDLGAPAEPGPFDVPAVPPARPQRGAAAADPFPSLTVPDDRRRYLDSVDGDVFPSTDAAPQEAREPSVLADSTEAQEESAPFPAQEGGRKPWERSDGAAKPWSAPTGAEPEAAGPSLGSDDVFDLAAPAPVAAAAPEEDHAPAPEPPPAAPPPPAVTQKEAPQEDREGAATVTLGRLYLRQGHLQEAEDSFREVLGREPENAAARAGLEEVAARRNAPLTAADLLEGFDPTRYGEGLTARKRYALEQYLERLRGGGVDVH